MGNEKEVSNKKPDVMFYLKQKTIRINLVLMTIIWVTVTFNYYMINFQVKYFPGDFGVNTIVMFGSDIPFCIMTGFMISFFRAKVVFLMFYVLQIIAGLSILFLVNPNEPGVIFPALVSCARGGVLGVFVTVYITHPKMFPTLFSVTSMGISNIFSRSIVIMAPMVAEISFPTPMIIFTILNTFALVCAYFIIDEEEPLKE